METVQQQRLQLKMKLLGYNKKIVDLRGREGGGWFLVEEDYPRLVRMMEF